MGPAAAAAADAGAEAADGPAAPLPPVPTAPQQQHEPYIVPPEAIAAFKRDGVVVLPDVFKPEEVAAARAGMAATLRAHGVVREWIDTRLGIILYIYIPISFTYTNHNNSTLNRM